MDNLLYFVLLFFFIYIFVWLIFGMIKIIMYWLFYWVFGCIFNIRIWMGGNCGIEVWFRRNVCIFFFYINLMVINFFFFSVRLGWFFKRSFFIYVSLEILEKLKKCRVDGDYFFDLRFYGKYISYRFILVNNV